ncbi:MAG: glutamine amidotransferase-related protein [Gammaproteobacteria bacterium]
MKQLSVIQHTSADYLGLMEDHLEGRRIRFTYHRPFTERGVTPRFKSVGDGLIMLGGGPWGSAGPRNVPSLVEEIELCYACLNAGLPVIGIGLGAQILSLAAGGTTLEAPLNFSIGYAERIDDAALNGFLPKRYPLIEYMRDRPQPPTSAKILSVDEQQRPALFQIGENAFGFTGHPGMKLAMAEDLIMEFDEVPANTTTPLASLRTMKTEIEDALVPIMTGLVQLTRLMQS